MIRDLRPLAMLVAAMVIVDALWNPVVLGWLTLFPVSFDVAITPVANAVDVAAFGFKILTMIIFAVWIYLAGRNLVAASVQELEFSAASRIWWFAVPIASLFKPFQGMRELWNASRGTWPYDQNGRLVSIWWAAWLAKILIARVVTTVMSHPATDGLSAMWIGSAFDIVAAALALPIVMGITRAQAGLHHADLEEVFA